MTRMLLSFLVLISFSVKADDLSGSFSFNEERNKFYLSTSTIIQSFNIEVAESSGSLAANSSFLAISQNISGQYFINDSFAISANYFNTLVIDIDAEMQGMGIGLEYFPLQNGTSKEVSIGNSRISTTPDIAPFANAQAVTRDIQFSSISFKFQGIEVGGGFYMHLDKNDLYLKGMGTLQYLENNNVRSITSFGASVGVGKSF